MSVLLLIFGLVFAGCDDSSSGGGGGGQTIPAAKGKLTITNIPSEHNGKYIWVNGTAGTSTALFGITDATGSSTADFAYKLVKITDGKAVVPLYKVNTSATSISDYFLTYEGSDAAALAVMIIDSTDGSLNYANASSVTPVAVKSIMNKSFSSGNLTVVWTEL